MYIMIVLLKQVANWLLPRVCVSCNLICDVSINIDLCPVCMQYFPWSHNGCYSCGIELVIQHESTVCKKCLNRPPPFNRICALFTYQQPIIKLINQLKFGQKLFVGKIFGQLLANAIKFSWYKHTNLPQLILPVPLHVKRQRRRGYNQAIEIAMVVGKKLQIPVGLGMCTRIIDTQPQARLNKEQRQLNVRDIFKVNVPKMYKHVVIIDDVVTTGNTITSLAKALIINGVEIIDVWCVARA